ncbi:MAG: hypothetical protein JNM10_13380 [Planctomycetia bacterium]|nr:hypothetical protein [Planctomycetia bacterium]
MSAVPTEDWVSPQRVLEEVASAIPEASRKNVVVIGSLAAGYQLLPEKPTMGLRTKDVDCMLSPRVEAVAAGRAWTEELFKAGWKFRPDEKWSAPGAAGTPDDALPAVRMNPPSGHAWFVELLTVPESPSDRGRRWMRVATSHGHFGLPSFGFLSLANYRPVDTAMGVRLARVEMMALANLLEHPSVGDAKMSGEIGGKRIKRSNKDLGRVLALFHLSDDDAIERWPELWQEALDTCFPDDARALGASVGSGIRALLENADDVMEARHSCEYGLLASKPLTTEQLRGVGRRLLADVIGPMERWGKAV